MKNEKSPNMGLLQTILAVIKTRESLKEDVVVLLADASALAVAVKHAAQRMSKSAAEISDAIKLFSDDVTRSVDSKTVILDVDNHADEDEDEREREWQEARRTRASFAK